MVKVTSDSFSNVVAWITKSGHYTDVSGGKFLFISNDAHFKALCTSLFWCIFFMSYLHIHTLFWKKVLMRLLETFLNALWKPRHLDIPVTVKLKTAELLIPFPWAPFSQSMLGSHSHQCIFLPSCHHSNALIMHSHLLYHGFTLYFSKAYINSIIVFYFFSLPLLLTPRLNLKCFVCFYNFWISNFILELS